MIHTSKKTKPVIDGERKVVLRRVDVGNFAFEGLVPRSKWSTMKAQVGVILMTQRAFLGATLHLPQLDGQFPAVGTVVPVALLKGRTQTRTGKAMDLHLKDIAATSKEIKADAKRYRAIKASIVG